MPQSNQVLIGWATRDISPDRPVNLCGQFHMRIAREVLDPVTVTALSLSAGDDAFTWVSCDLVLVPTEVLEACREKLHTRLPEFPGEKLVISVTHTHTAPDPIGVWHPPVPEGVMTAAEFKEFLAERIVEAVIESWQNRQPGSVCWGNGCAVIGHNRRAVYFDDLSKRPGFNDSPGTKTEKCARMYGNMNDPQISGLEGYVDHGVNLLFTFDTEGRLTGAVYNLPCTSQETEGLDVISADFWHEARLELRQRHGDSLFVLPLCAPAGDLSPHPMYNKAAEARMLQLKGRTSRQEIAMRLAAAFDETLAWAQQDRHEQVELKHVTRNISLKRRFITEEEYRDAQDGLAALEQITPAAGDNYMEQASVLHARKFRCRRIIQRYEEQQQQSTLPMELHVIRLGDVAFASNPFELFLDYGLRMVARSPALQTFLVQLTAGGPTSYLATEKAVAGESYSACLYCNEVGPEGGQQLVEETVNTLNQLWS
ncbi:MAG: hypothetical protein ACYDCO_01335 [Armatimonadota bacterium]